MQLEEVQALVNHILRACLLQVPGDDFLLLSALRAHRRGVPELDQQGLQVVRQPKAFIVGVLQREEHVLVVDHCALGNSLDDDRQVAAMLLDDVLPGAAIKQLLIEAPDGVREVDLKVLLGLLDLRFGDDRADHVLLQVVLQTEEANLFVSSSSALEVAVDLGGSRRVLQVVGHLVGVREHDDIVEAIHVSKCTSSKRRTGCARSGVGGLVLALAGPHDSWVLRPPREGKR
mmetsp:Transcript_102420/g.330447  ORF Transcript_102420/g.330447 Transcript_102420/m.330447 type:complete len:231 (-) Transcript_102420:69-761(-)